MADSLLMFGLTNGIFAFLVAILFTLRARRHHMSEHRTKFELQSANGAAGSGRRIRKFKSDGTPVHE